jgi:hypothetical protein
MEFGEATKNHFRRCTKGLVLLVAGASFVYRVAEWRAVVSLHM